MAGLPGRELVMEDLKVCSALVSQSINHRNGATGGRKELRSRRGLLAQNPSLWGCLMSICRHLLLSSKESGTPFRYLQWPSHSLSPPCCPHHLLTVPEKPRLFVLVKTQPSRQPLGLSTSLSAPESQGWDLHLSLLLPFSYRPTGQDTGLGSLLSVFSCVTLGQPLLKGP